jgi:phenylacetic acid degradation operon negative regulatory protein
VTAAGSPSSLGPDREDVAERRRAVGSGSARSLLLTILGEFVLPRAEPVWTGSLVAGLGDLGVEEKAARQALARTAADGVLRPDRVGRRTRWELSDHGQDLLRSGAARIFGFMRERRAWDGRWLVLAVTVPETRRSLRHRLRTRLTWVGMGSPTAGLWVVPDADRTEEVASIVADLGIGANAMSWVGPAAGIGDPHDLVAAAWTLDVVEQAYEEFVTRFSGQRVRTGREAFGAQVSLVQAWRRFPFLDPELPAELLDHDWPGPAAAALFHRCHERWHDAAQAHWDELAAQADAG